MMAGDVDIFLNRCDEEGIAEIGVMIVEKKCRNKGLATEAC